MKLQIRESNRVKQSGEEGAKSLRLIPTIEQGLSVIVKNPIILVPIVISAILTCIFIYFFTYAPKLAVEPGVIPELPAYFWTYATLFTFVSMFLSLIICKMVYDAVKSNVSISEAINLSLRKLIFVFIASMLYFLIGIIGLVALIIPGIFLLNKFIFYSYAILLDNEKIIDSLKKSWQIVTGNWWRVFGLHLIFLIPIIILSLTASMIVRDSLQIALALDFVSFLLSGWLISAFTIAYIQLTKQEAEEIIYEK